MTGSATAEAMADTCSWDFDGQCDSCRPGGRSARLRRGSPGCYQILLEGHSVLPCHAQASPVVAALKQAGDSPDPVVRKFTDRWRDYRHIYRCLENDAVYWARVVKSRVFLQLYFFEPRILQAAILIFWATRRPCGTGLRSSSPSSMRPVFCGVLCFVC